MDPLEVAALTRAGKRKRLWTASPGTEVVDMGHEAIHKLLPHRAPFLFVDRITAVDLTQRTIAGRRRILPSDPQRDPRERRS